MEKDPALKEKKKFRYGKYFVGFLGVTILILVCSYGFLALGGSNQSLPRLVFSKNDVGAKTKLEIKYIIDKVQKKIETENIGVQISVGDTKVSKSYLELGIVIDSDKTADKIFSYGKIKGKYPSYKYVLETVKGKIPILSEVRWTKSPQEAIKNFADERKVEPENPKIVISGNTFKIEDGKNGQTIDVQGLKESIEKCFYTNCKDPISTKVIGKRSNFTLNDLAPFNDQISTILNTKYVFQNENNKVKPDMEQLAKFIDLEMTALNQKLTLNDKEIENYLNSISGKFTQKAKSKKISTVDNSVMDEGREGTKLDIKPSILNVKNALLNGDRIVNLEVTTSEIKEEFISPGNNPGKYPGKYIEVNLSEQNLYQFEGANLIAIYRVSTGKWSMPTPEGEYSINNKDPRAYSQEYGLYMPYWMAFIGSLYGIHELPEWPGGAKEGEGHLGTPVSHGCIRLGRGAAETVYNWVEIGTPVYTHR